jgi:membrane-bound lytic murein transglycosylase B
VKQDEAAGMIKAVVTIVLAGSALGAAAAGTVDGGFSYAGRDDAMRFAADVAEARRLDADWVRGQLAQARYVPAVAKLIAPPPAGTPKNWAAYRARFIEPARVRAGADFWRRHQSWLSQAEQRYGVPASIVVGIVGVETLYGKHTGGFRAIDALATLAFDFPRDAPRDRSAFFRDELGALLALAAREGVAATSMKGSYAGALGLPQFMPSSWSRFAIDFDGDGKVDLQRSAPDAIGSVARYLAEFGWITGRPTHFDVAAPTEPADRAVLLAPDIVPNWNADYLAERGAQLSPAGRAFDRALALVELQNGDAPPSYVAGTSNFYAITRYNWSSYYAMAVIELGAAVQRAVETGRIE